MSSQNPTFPAEPSADPEADLLFELFEEALSLHSAGIAYASVLAKCPPALRVQLRQQLDMAMHLQATAPAMARPRNQAQRTSNRAAFMRAAHSLGNQPIPTTKSPLDAISEALGAIGAALENLTRRLSELVPQYSPRLSPILAMIALLIIGTVGAGRAYASALPGDAIYPVKEFVRDTEESFASEAERERVIQKNENARRQDTEKAATQRQQLIEVTRDMQFYQKGESVWDIGGQTVLPGYPPDPISRPNHLLSMDFTGDPQPGDIVRLTYLIVPGKPNFVYGKRLVVLETIAPTPTPAPIVIVVTPTTIPTLAPVQCEPTKPFGWVDYRIRRNDTLESLAVNTGVQAGLLKQVNCRQFVDVGSTVSLPAVIDVIVTDPNQPVAQPTPTLIPVLTATPLPTVTEPTATEPTATEPTATEPTATEVASPTVAETATAEATTPAATPTAEEATPTEIAATPTEEVATPSPTSEGGVGIDTPTATVATPIAEDTPTPTTAVENTPTETSTAVEVTPTLTPQEAATATPTSEEATATPVAETPTSEPQPTATQLGSETATPMPDTPIPATPIANTPVPQATATPLSEQPTAVPAEPTVNAGGDDSANPTPLPPATEIPQPTPVPTTAP